MRGHPKLLESWMPKLLTCEWAGAGTTAARRDSNRDLGTILESMLENRRH